MKSRSLQSKLFFAYISLACLILFSFAVFFYAFVSRQLKQSQISAMNTLNSSFQTQVDSAIRNLDAVSVNINYSNQSKTILDNSFNLNISSNMLSAMSQVDFYLYQNQQASGRMIFTVKNDFMISALLVNPDRCMSVTISSNEKNCNPIYHGIKDRCTRESLLCRRTSMKEMLSSHDYMHSILSLHSKWGIGHMTEHFLPDDLFHEILDLLKSSNDELFFDEDHLCYLHSMTQRTLAESEIDLFIHCQALSDLVVDGNLDFYDQKVHLTLSQRKKYFNHLLHVFETNSNLTFKLAKEPMILDFKYQTNQCIFLSDQFSYIRLNTYNWANNLAIINHPNLKHMFDRFFNAVWNDATSELLSDYSEIHSFFIHIIQQINILSEI